MVEHPSFWFDAPSKADSISSSGMSSTLIGLPLALISIVK